MGKYINKNLLKICIILGIVVAGCETLGIYLDDKMVNATNGMSFYILRMLLWLFGTSIVLYFGTQLGRKIVSDKKLVEGVFAKFWVYWLIILVAWLPCFIAYFPGIYSYDGEPQLIQYLNGKFDNHHPILHTLILGWSYDFGLFLKSHGINIEGLCFYSILQMMLLSFSYSKIIDFLIKRKIGRWAIYISFAFFALFPVHPLMAISITKDTAFTAFLILFLLELINTLEDSNTSLLNTVNECGQKNGKKVVGRTKWYTAADIKLLVFGVVSMFFRRNGYYVILLTFLLCFIVFVVRLIRTRIRNKGNNINDTDSITDEGDRNAARVLNIVKLGKLLIILFASIVFFFVSEKILITATNAESGESAEMLNLPLEQIGRAYKNNEQQIREEFGERLDKFVPQEGLANYRPFISDGIKMWFNNDYFNEHKSEFIGLYIDIGKKYISDYVMATLYLTRGDWYVTDISHCEVYKDWWRDRVGYMITDATPVFALGYIEKSNPIPAVRNFYENIVTDMSYRNCIVTTILFSPALYIFITLISGIVFVIKKRKTLIISWLPILIYFLTVIAGPCVLVRYIFPFMATLPIFVILALENKDSVSSAF